MNKDRLCFSMGVGYMQYLDELLKRKRKKKQEWSKDNYFLRIFRQVFFL